MRLGRWDEAEELVERLGMTPYGSCAQSPYVIRLPFAIYRGKYDDAERLLVTAHELTDGLADVQQSAMVHAMDAEFALERGRADAAARLIRRAHELAADA